MAARKSVVLMREKGERDCYEKILTERGYLVHFIPAIKCQLVNLNGLRDTWKNLQQYSGVIFTSQNAVEAVKQIASEPSLKQLSSMAVFTVGEATSNAVSRHLGVRSLGEGSGNAEALSATIIQYHRQHPLAGPLLFPCGNIRKDTISKRLQEHSISVHCQVCYDTLPHPDVNASLHKIQDMTEEGVYIVFFSPSGVQYAKTDLPHLLHHKLCAIGPSTGEALMNLGVQEPLVAAKPTPSSLLDLLST